MLRSALLTAADTTERVLDRLKFSAKWRYHLWDHLRVQPYRGFGTRGDGSGDGGSLYLRGRVLDDRRPEKPSPGQPTWRNALSTLRRVESDEIPDARVRLELEGEPPRHATTDEDGFFYFDVRRETAWPDPERVWQEMRVALEAPVPDASNAEDATEPARVIVPHTEEADFAVVSDLDDTVIRTGATNKLQMARVILLNNASTRAPFPGVGALYRALAEGPDAESHNPIFYVSSSPYNLYDMFQGFFEAQNIPPGPLFLKDYGITAEHFFKTGHGKHKTERVERLVETYPDLRFVLVGDSGQHDPEIYRQVVGDHGPEHIRAVFIRDVTSPERDAEVHAIARQVERMGVPMFLVEDTAEAAARAVEQDLITEDAAETVREEMERAEREKEAPSGWRERLLG
jgi:phosphatidate phosphatase APP1